MMIREFQFYLDNDMAKKSAPDKIESDALISKSEGRLNFSIKIRKIDENTSSYIFEDIYECMREAAQSLMSLKGYKPYSHEALISCLREFFNFSEKDLSAFDRYRILRNKTIYKGEKISAETCKEALDFLMTFLPKIKKEFKKLGEQT